ncbi:hypothetical protein LUZ61_015634 [Rhynchospora tenuis]|uniref:Dof zinc finger protein n=1 Tax=Rhynchospora tenuis TaxID=198213 RepID=A0AAD5Z3Z4_9POAL|nr:hypothetical protein LUZ61_015634 [Rhynchospora tenuis]
MENLPPPQAPSPTQNLDQNHKPNQIIITSENTDQQNLNPVACPRCNSTNTKFCYYNNYNLSQPRHFCKNCRRYWTKGGALRNIPVGGGTRKNSKRANSAPSKRPSKTVHVSPSPQSQSVSPPVEPERQPLLLDCAMGSFSSLLASNGHFGNFSADGCFLGGPGAGNINSSVDSSGNEMLWPGSWADLSIYTPGPTYQ